MRCWVKHPLIGAIIGSRTQGSGSRREDGGGDKLRGWGVGRSRIAREQPAGQNHRQDDYKHSKLPDTDQSSFGKAGGADVCFFPQVAATLPVDRPLKRVRNTRRLLGYSRSPVPDSSILTYRYLAHRSVRGVVGDLNETVSVLGRGARRHTYGDNISPADKTTLQQTLS